MYLGHKGTIKKAICTGIGSITCHQFFDYVICCLYNAHTFTIHYVSAISIALGTPSLEMHFFMQKRTLLILDTNSVRSNFSIKLTDSLDPDSKKSQGKNLAILKTNSDYRLWYMPFNFDLNLGSNYNRSCEF